MKAYREPAFDDSDDALMTPDANSVAVRIAGLTHVRNDVFRIQGAKPRDIDWGALFRAIGEPDDGTVDERLADAIGRAICRHDILNILLDRMQVD